MLSNRGELRSFTATAALAVGRLLRYSAQSVLVFTLIALAGPAFARTAYDGTWSVLIVTRSGACDPALRYPVAIANGRVLNAGDTPAAVQGRVAPSGAVSVTLQSGGQWASGSGRLKKNSGSGVWRGQGTRGFCQGTWQAVRRGYGAEATERGAPSYYGYAPGYYGSGTVGTRRPYGR